MKRYDFVKNRKYAFAFSIALFIFFAIMLIINGIALDINFRGGTRIMIETIGEVDPNRAEDIVESAIGKDVAASVMKTFSGNDDNENRTVNMLRIDIAGNEPLTADEEDKVKEVISQNFDVVLNSPNNENVSITPTVGRETLQKGILAVVVSVVLILLYVTWRFSTIGGFSAAACGILALAHDVGVMFGVYITLKIPLNDIFIATILTVIGYSINDTVIIYDRIRENTGFMRKSDLGSIVNVSIHQSLNRSINTMVTTLISVVVLLVFSATNNIGSLIDFSFSLLIGVVTGAYSSIFIAAPLWVFWKERRQKAALQKQ
ncbi:MAG TPA: protein translocase subunit SecF [Clostridiaceae bacterium]|nr:protein translocase subunit SecF [Clostridiaceae bacterium]